MFTMKTTTSGGKKKKANRTDEIVHLTGEIDTESAEDICRRILSLVDKGRVEQIQLVINSGGGSVYAGFGIVDIIDWCPIPVHTVAYGVVASMALNIFIAGDKGNRLVLPNTWFMAHQYSSMNIGTYRDLVTQRGHEDELHGRLVDHALKHTSIRGRKSIERELLPDHDRWIDPTTAVSLGIADRVFASRK